MFVFNVKYSWSTLSDLLDGSLKHPAAPVQVRNNKNVAVVIIMLAVMSGIAAV